MSPVSGAPAGDAVCLAPITVKAAQRYVAIHHRHLPRLQGGMFAVAVADETGLVRGVAIAGNPARVWQGTGRIAILRVASDGVPQGCSMLYGALCRAAKATRLPRGVDVHAARGARHVASCGWLRRDGSHRRRRARPALAPSCASRAQRTETPMDEKGWHPMTDPAISRERTIDLPCLCCGRVHAFSVNSYEGRGVFNVFCDGECEDRYAARL